MFYNFSNTNFKRKQEHKKTALEIFEDYSGQCVASNCQPTLSGLARAFGYPDLKSFRKDCDNNLEYQDFVLRIQQYYEENLTKQGGNSYGAKFALSAMFGWKDEKNINVTTVSEKDELKDLTSDQLRALLK